MAQSAMVLVKKPHSNSVSYIPPLKTTLSPSLQKKAIRILSPMLPPGWQTCFKPRRYGNSYGIPNYCGKCGKTVRAIIEEDRRNPDTMSWPQRRRYLLAHLQVAH